jgi:SAM-dependent methyltransferase
MAAVSRLGIPTQHSRQLGSRRWEPLHAILERPRVYASTWRALAPGTARVLLARIRTELGPSTRGRVLDVGCGPRSWLERAGLDPVCVDASIAYAKALRRAGGKAVVACAEALPFRAGAFTSVWSFGLLHHLADEPAREALAEATRVTAGRVVIFDGVLPRQPIRRPLAWLIRRFDRGRFQRSEGALRELLSDARIAREEDPLTKQEWRVSRLTYSRTGLEGLWCVRQDAHVPDQTVDHALK